MPNLSHSIFCIAESIDVPIDVPNSPKSNVVTNECAKSIAVFIPFAIDFPTVFQSVSSINPFKKLAIFVPIVLAVFRILSHGIFFNASFNFLPTVIPISFQSPFF